MQLRFLLDTNIVIPAEPTSREDVEEATPVVAELLATLARGKHSWLIHPGTYDDVERDMVPERRSLRRALLGKYEVLACPPPLSSELVAELGTPTPGSNDEVDFRILAALDADCADYVVTHDQRMRRRARRIGLGARVVTAADALSTVRALFPTVPLPPPLVRSIPAHLLRDTDPIFDSLRAEYQPDFEGWLKKCKRQQRPVWLVERDQAYAGICIVNEEPKPEFGLTGRVLKLCTFKISDRHLGFRYGELLLKTIFEYLAANQFDHTFIEVLPHHEELCALLADFGFEERARIVRGQRLLAKALKPPPDSASLKPYDFHVRYGPRHLKIDGVQGYIAPIQPRYHEMLFPDAERQLSMVPTSRAFGNSIRKAYLCGSMIRCLEPGDFLLFYRSHDLRAVTTVCVVEDVLVSTDAVEIARFVGKLTVYNYEEIEQMARKPVLAVLFRLARILDTPWSLELIKRSGVVRAPPQSFASIPKASPNG